METTLFWFLAFALLYLLFTSLVLLRNRFDLTPLSYPDSNSTSKKYPKISVCIPARNEENCIGVLLDSVCTQNYPNYDVHVLDDQSEDSTPEILDVYHKKFKKILSIHRGKKKPENWLGKPWACQQLADVSDGDLLLFLDADTTLKPRALDGIVHSFSEWNLDMITLWPQQRLGTFWERTVIPLIYYTLVTLLPAAYVYRHPRWLPHPVRKKMSPKFAAACGQCLGFTRYAYQQIGGHQAVKEQIVEDVELSKLIKKHSFTLRMFHGIGAVSCRMYRTHQEMFEGLRKNFLAGFNHSVPIFTLSALAHIVVFVLPFISFIYGLWIPDPAILFLSGASISLILMHRLLLALWFQWNPIYAFTHPLGILWFQILGLIKIFDHFTERKTSWKGRPV